MIMTPEGYPQSLCHWQVTAGVGSFDREMQSKRGIWMPLCHVGASLLAEVTGRCEAPWPDDEIKRDKQVLICNALERREE